MAEAFNNFFTTIDPDLMVRYTKQVSNLSLTFVPLTKLFFFPLKAPNVTTTCILSGEINERKASGLCYRSKCALSMNNLLASRNCDFTQICKLIRLIIFYLTNFHYDGIWTADVLIF